MSVKIRLRRVGRKKQPSYRLVVTDSASARDGQYIEVVGFYNPRTRPAELRLDLEKLDAWMAKGAGLSDTVASLVRKARRGGDDSVQLKAAPAAQAAEPAEAKSAAPVEAEAAAPAKAGSRGRPKAEAAAAEPEAAAAEPESAAAEPESAAASEPEVPAEEPPAEDAPRAESSDATDEEPTAE
jgi:small subunit ribosomal protein S16